MKFRCTANLGAQQIIIRLNIDVKMTALTAESTHKFALQTELKQCSWMSGNTLAKYLAGFSAHLLIVISANSKCPDV